MEFYTLQYSARSFDDVSDFFQFEPTLRSMGDAPVCPDCHTAIGAKVWQSPFRAKLIGKNQGDMCRGSGQQFLVSHQFRTAWMAQSLKGITFSDDLVGLPPWLAAQKKPPKYFVAFPTHTLTHLNENESGVDIDKMIGCDTCRVAQRRSVARLRIDYSTWTGEDVFYPSGLYGVLVVTKRFVEFVKSNNLTNFLFTHEDQFSESWLARIKS